jgi:pimeloyl-ACP methyl ester carboxylesterase
VLRDAVRTLGVERPVVVGHSFGAAVAMAWALQFPDELAGVVAVAPVSFPEPRLEQILFGLRAVPVAGDWLSMMAVPVDQVLMPLLWNGMFLPQKMTRRFKGGFPFELAAGRAQLRADGEEAALMLSSLGLNAMNYWRCRTPVHVLQGDCDRVANPALHGKGLAALLPDARYTEFRGLGHMLHHFEPEAVAEAVAELHGLDAGPAALAA